MYSVGLIIVIDISPTTQNINLPLKSMISM